MGRTLREGRTLRAMRRDLALVAAACLALAPASTRAADTPWEPWQKVAGVFDVDGPRSDGSLVVAGSAALYLVDPAGTVTPFARGPGGYHEDPGVEAYLAVSQGGHVNAAECDFVRDETFLLRLHVPMGINRVSAAGDESGPFTNITGATALSGIAFDTVGAFDHRLLVLGRSGAKNILFAIDCNGAVQVITDAAPGPEGGLAVAPTGFGSFGGALIVPNETNGTIYAVAPDGTSKVIVKPTLPQSFGVTMESVGFVPSGFMSRGGAVYFADWKFADASYPGSDTLLRLTSEQLSAAGVQDGDMLATTELGGALISVHCETSCTVTQLVGPTKAHGEGHIAFTVQPPAPSPVPSPSARGPRLPAGLVTFVGEWGIPTTALALLLGLLAAVGLQAVRRRTR